MPEGDRSETFHPCETGQDPPPATVRMTRVLHREPRQRAPWITQTDHQGQELYDRVSTAYRGKKDYRLYGQPLPRNAF